MSQGGQANDCLKEQLQFAGLFEPTDWPFDPRMNKISVDFSSIELAPSYRLNEFAILKKQAKR